MIRRCKRSAIAAEQIQHQSVQAGHIDKVFRRPRKPLLLPSRAANDRRNIQRKLQALKPRHASGGSSPAYACTIVRTQVVRPEVKAGQGREMRDRGQQRFKRPTSQPVAAKVQAGDASVEHEGARKRTAAPFAQIQ